MIYEKGFYPEVPLQSIYIRHETFCSPTRINDKYQGILCSLILAQEGPCFASCPWRKRGKHKHAHHHIIRPWYHESQHQSIIIIIMSCGQHRYPWQSLATSPYHSSPPAGLLGYIPCPHIPAVCKFGLVVLLLLGHMWGSIGVRHLRARPCFSSSVRRVWLV